MSKYYVIEVTIKGKENVSIFRNDQDRQAWVERNRKRLTSLDAKVNDVILSADDLTNHLATGAYNVDRIRFH